MLIERVPQFLRRALPFALFRLPASQPRTVYLTFDDGPIPEATPGVLDILDRYGIKATFFMVGDNARRYPELVAEVRRRGHALGAHTMHHLQGIRTPLRRYLRDALQAQELVGTRLFRPPHGFLTPRQGRLLSRRLRVVMFDLVTRDYSSRLSEQQVLDNVQRYARPGSIIVFHDSLRSLPRMGALPRAIEWLMDQGYQFGTLRADM